METAINNLQIPKLLIVDDNEMVRSTLSAAMAVSNFVVTTAAGVSEALHLIDTEVFDVLLCDLHMPGAGDGFTVISAMRHTNPKAITLMFTGFPALKEAMDAILMQADEVLVKPMPIPELAALIRNKLQNLKVRKSTNTERVAVILKRDSAVTIANWLARVNKEPELMVVSLNDQQRTGHLPRLMDALVTRLQISGNLGTKTKSEAAILHGETRRKQGYSVSMLVEESRILQVSIFETLQRNLGTVDYSLLLMDVMTIADEVDSQLKQTINSFMCPETGPAIEASV
jgi:DNA-binding NtrC family response regulator